MMPIMRPLIDVYAGACHAAGGRELTKTNKAKIERLCHQDPKGLPLGSCLQANKQNREYKTKIEWLGSSLQANKQTPKQIENTRPRLNGSAIKIPWLYNVKQINKHANKSYTAQLLRSHGYG